MERHGYRGHVELRDQPEEQLERHCQWEVNLEVAFKQNKEKNVRRAGSKGENTHGNGQLLSNPRCDKPQDDPTDCNAHPKSSSRHAAGKRSATSDADHERDDPSAQRNFGTDISQQKESQEPDDSRRRFCEESLLHAVLISGGGAGVVGAELGACSAPERRYGCDELEERRAKL